MSDNDIKGNLSTVLALEETYSIGKNSEENLATTVLFGKHYNSRVVLNQK